MLINPSEERGAAKQPGEEKRSRVVKQKDASVCFPARGTASQRGGSVMPVVRARLSSNAF
ncbi:hypothetical protein GCM10011513_17240 [Franconibacter daqui]|nr:hypothetical protein GCM10011513_17240 [Franconibacter daqui]